MEILNLFGSTQDAFYYDLSKMYASAVFRPAGTQHVFASVAPDGLWRFGPEPDRLGDPLTLSQAMGAMPAVDLVVPHMFCRAGMTTYRALMEDIVGLPVMGAPATVAGLATSKIWTRDIVSAAGVRVAEGSVVERGRVPDLPLPYVVKPNSEDNSLGVSIVRRACEVERAVCEASKYDDVVLAEAYIPGREIRVAVIEMDGTLHVPAMIEYPVSEARPIREMSDKLEPTGDPGAMRQSRRANAQPICPAVVSPDLAQRLASAARAAHKAMGARHYSLFDFRVHAETGDIYLLEAGLFWSFSSLSAISKMLAGEGQDPAEVTHRLWSSAVACHRSSKSKAA